MRSRPLLTALCLALIANLPALRQVCGGAVYDDAMREFARHEQRLPGSPEYEACLQSVERLWRAAGLEPHRQSFDTLAPSNRVCRFSVDGRPARIYPLAPNEAVPVTTGDAVLEGPLVYLGDGSPAELRGKPVAGSLAVLELGSPHMGEVFSEGARAVIFVSNETATRWNTSAHFTAQFANFPRFYLPREEAQELGLLSKEPPFRTGSLQAQVVWRDVVGENLWVELPGDTQAVFNLDLPEALILTARLDTFGIVPELSPQRRSAANAALLAELAVELSRQPLKRTVFVVLLGAEYSAMEGARNFLYAVYQAGKETTASLPVRQGYYEDELREVDELLGTLEAGPIAVNETTAQFKVRMKLREKMDARVNDLSYELVAINQELRRAGGADLARTKTARMAEKTAWNEMRRQLHERKIAPESRERYARLAEALRLDLERERGEIERRLANNRSAREIAGRIGGKAVIGQVHLDLASSDAPWAFGILSADLLFARVTVPPSLGSYVKMLSAFGSVYDRVAEASWPAPLLASALSGDFNAACLPLQRPAMLGSAPAMILGLPGFTMLSVTGGYDADELPFVHDVALDRLTPELSRYFAALVNAPEMSLRSSLPDVLIADEFMYRREGGKYQGMRFFYTAKGSSEVQEPAAGALVESVPWGVIQPTAGHAAGGFSRVNSQGFPFLPMLRREWAFNGNNTRAIAFGENGELNRMSQSGADFQRLFFAYGGGAYCPFTPLTYDWMTPPDVYRGANDGRFSQWSATVRDSVLAIYVDRDQPVKLVGNGATVLGASEADPKGKGVPVAPTALNGMNMTREAAVDTVCLNGSRLDRLRRRNIFNDSVEALHVEAREQLKEADAARKAGDVEKARAHETFALALSWKAYTPLKGMVDDMVSGVVVLLLLCLPFAFAMERLLLGFTNIYRQVLGFSGFFIGTFLLLYFLHPAFSLAEAPTIIFLAFVMILLSGAVIYVVMSKFKSELMAMQGMASRTHRLDAESSTALASVVIGISTMRNRPLKTFLTTLTIVLLTFTIISFASFSTRTGVQKTYLQAGAGDARIELVRPTHLSIPKPLDDAIGALFGGRYQVCRRNAHYYDPTIDHRFYATVEDVLYNPLNRRTLKLDSLLGFTPAETRCNAVLAGLFPGLAAKPEDALPPIFLSDLAAQRLELQPDQIVIIRGKRFRFAGPFSARRLAELDYLDESKAISPDYKSTGELRGTTFTGAGAREAIENFDPGSFVWTAPELNAITTFDAVEQLDGATVSLLLYPRTSEADLDADAGRLADVFNDPVHAKSAAGVSRYFFTKSLEGTGFSEIVVPLLLGALIIFSALMGSIVDREREIFTFSALGLAPVDVAALFFAESSVYAVVGGMGGYLFSQFVSWFMQILSRFGVFQAPEMNFSSLSTIYTILIVMGAVILSTIYPAIKAGRSANPGIARKWRMPKPEGDLLRFVFPFTVSGRDIGGILAFIAEHFKNHGDAALGQFATRDVRIVTDRGGGDVRPGLSADVALAPFDLGVLQSFAMTSRPSDIAGIDEIVVELRKLNGSGSAWLRGNRAFVDDLRRQFLIWRALPVATMMKYRGDALEKPGAQQPGAAIG